MRRSEWINLIFYSLFIVLAGSFALKRQRRMNAILTGGFGLGLILVQHSISRFLSPFTVSIIGDGLPAFLILMAYWQAGQFFQRSNMKIQDGLEPFDHKLFDAMNRFRMSPGVRTWRMGYLELSYLLCYPMVPAGLGVLYLAGMRDFSEEFWMMVLPSA